MLMLYICYLFYAAYAEGYAGILMLNSDVSDNFTPHFSMATLKCEQPFDFKCI